MTVTLISTEDLGDRYVRVVARSEAGHDVAVVMSRERLGTPAMAEMLAVAGAQADADDAALRARTGRSDQDLT